MGPGALRRGLNILNAIRTGGKDGLTIAQIAALTGIHRPTVYRLIEILEQEHYVRRLGDHKHFVSDQPEAETPDLWQTFQEQMRPLLQSVASKTGACVFLVRQDSTDALCLLREIGPYPIQVVAHNVGELLPLGVGGAGLALLAALKDDEIVSILAKNSSKYKKYGNLTPQKVLSLVENTRTRDFAVVGNHALQGVLSVGVPIHTKAGKPVGAIGVTATVDRMTVAVQEMFAKTVERELISLGNYSSHGTSSSS